MNAYSGSREAFAQALIDISEKDSRTLFVSADSLKAMRAAEFARRFPDRYIEVGIAEQNAVNVAAGLASCGLVPFVGTYAGFITMRACEQLRTFVAYPGLNVKLIGINGGMLGGEREGVTHQFFEDLGIVRSIPGITVLTPADPYQVYGAVVKSMEIEGPVYIRCASGREPVVYGPDLPFTFARNRIVREYGRDLAVFSSGFILNKAVEAVDSLNGKGIRATLVDVSTLKPADEEGTVKILSECKAAVTVEDHNVIGGLGSAIAEAAARHCPVPVENVGLQDIFPESGEANALLEKYGISADSIMQAAVKVLARKKNLS